jgi:uncharacterized membrane protein YecN with MAPEG domain
VLWEFLIAYGPLIQVIAIVVGVLAAATFLIWCIVGLVLWFVRGTHDSRVDETEQVEWFDE